MGWLISGVRDVTILAVYNIALCLGPEAHVLPAEVDHDLDMAEGSQQFAVCPPGGCFAALSEAEQQRAAALHTALCVIVRGHAPARNRLAANPLAVLWEHRPSGEAFAAVLAFRTYTANMDMLFRELDSEGICGRAAPYHLRFQSHALRAGVPAHWNDLALCVHLGKKPADWTISRLLLGDIEEDPSVISVDGREDFEIDHLLAEAAQIKEEQRALRAARVAHGSSGKKTRKSRSRRGRGGDALGHVIAAAEAGLQTQSAAKQ